MNIGIYYILKKNSSLATQQSENNEVVFSGASDYYCTNPFTALKIAYNLCKENKDYRYGLQNLPQDIANSKTHIDSYEAYIDYCNDKIASNEPLGLDII